MTDTSHISVEPLLNQSTIGLGTSKKLTFTPINEIGACSNRAAVNVTATAQEITIGTNKRTIEIYNGGSADIYYGGSGVTSATGIPIFADYIKTFNNVQDTFSIYLVCATGQTATARIVEYA